jgi:hypothetical protein
MNAAINQATFGLVPQTRTINGKPLSSDVNLSIQDLTGAGTITGMQIWTFLYNKAIADANQVLLRFNAFVQCNGPNVDMYLNENSDTNTLIRIMKPALYLVFTSITTQSYSGQPTLGFSLFDDLTTYPNSPSVNVDIMNFGLSTGNSSSSCMYTVNVTKPGQYLEQSIRHGNPVWNSSTPYPQIRTTLIRI